MERTLDFSEVTRYDFSVMSSGMIVKLFQGDTITKIRIGTGKAVQTVFNEIEKEAVNEDQIDILSSIVKKEQATVVNRKKSPVAKLNEAQVREIRSNWDATVKACGTKNAAAEQLARVYECSAKNIYAIIYRYSWANI